MSKRDFHVLPRRANGGVGGLDVTPALGGELLQQVQRRDNLRKRERIDQCVAFGVERVITRDKVKYAKPDPDLFLAAAAALKVPIENACVVGDSIWDMLAARRAGALGVGLLSGGYGRDELERSSAYRVYEDPADLLKHIDEVGGRS